MPTPKNAPALEAISTEMAKAPDVVSVSTPVFADNNGSALLSAVLSVDPEDIGARNAIDWMRAHLPSLPAAGGAQVDVGGPTALIKDFDDRVSTTQPLVFVFVALIAFVMLLISVRSVFLAFKGVLMTVLSVAAAYGSLVMVFQWGWLEGLGFERITSIDSTIPPLVLAMTFGLSMDYEIFLLTRIRERYLQAGDTRDAVAYGVSTSARTITSAALIMIAVFTGFAFAGMPLVAELGVACAVAIAVDATIVRLVLVPALMAMFDQWNWWLPALAGPHPAVGRLREAAAQGRPRRPGRHPRRHLPLVPPSADLRMVVKGAARLKSLAPDAVSVADPLAFTGCSQLAGRVKGSDDARAQPVRVGAGSTATVKLIRGYRSGRMATPRPVHPVTMWRGRLAIALDALETGADTAHRVGRAAQPGGDHQRPVAHR